jgi:putative oxidoreductase
MSTSANLAFLVLRLVGGLTLAAHGAQKLLGWFEGPGPAKLAQGFRAQGFKPAELWVGLVILGEFGGGLSLALGLLTPLGAAGGVGAMCMAIVKSHWKNGFWNSKRGLEFPLALLAISVAVGLAGPGAYSLDSLFFGLRLPETLLFVVLAVAALLVDAIGLFISRPAAAPAAAQPSARAS